MIISLDDIERENERGRVHKVAKFLAINNFENLGEEIEMFSSFFLYI